MVTKGSIAILIGIFSIIIAYVFTTPSLFIITTTGVVTLEFLYGTQWQRELTSHENKTNG